LLLLLLLLLRLLLLLLVVLHLQRNAYLIERAPSSRPQAASRKVAASTGWVVCRDIQGKSRSSCLPLPRLQEQKDSSYGSLRQGQHTEIGR
jgi:hypothetical protein